MQDTKFLKLFVPMDIQQSQSLPFPIAVKVDLIINDAVCWTIRNLTSYFIDPKPIPNDMKTHSLSTVHADVTQ